MPDTNDDQAKALATALLPHLIASLKTDVLPGLIEDQIGGLKKNTEAVLDELKSKTREKSALENLLEAVDKRDKDNALKSALPDRGNTDKDPVRLTREEARDRRKYLDAQALAAKRGVPFEITDGKAERSAHALDGQTHLKTETTMFIHKDAIRDARTYARLKAQAQDDHLEIQPISDWNDLPEGAVPHD